ncbi:MAG: hypothetical protein ABGZ53_20215 [Fuerstiella sp.]
MMVETYQHSGRVGSVGIPLMVVIGGISAIVLAILYTYILAWIPFIYVSFLATGGFGAVLGLIAGWSARAGKVRNPLLVSAFGGVAGMLGLYVAWAFDGIARFGAEDFPGILLSPEDLMNYITFFYNEGFWSIGRGGGAMVSGIPLALIWIVEAAMIVGASWMLAGGFTASHPYCESCNRWTDRVEGFCMLHPPEENENAIQQLCDGDTSILSQFSKSPPNAVAFLRLDTARCPDCDECNCINVVLAQITVDKDGTSSTNTETLVENMMVSASDMEQINDTVEGLPMAELPESEDEEVDDGEELNGDEQA